MPKHVSEKSDLEVGNLSIKFFVTELILPGDDSIGYYSPNPPRWRASSKTNRSGEYTCSLHTYHNESTRSYSDVFDASTRLVHLAWHSELEVASGNPT